MNCLLNNENDMKKVYLIFLFSFICVSLYSQDKYQSFIIELTQVYDRNCQKFQKESKKAMKHYYKAQKEQLQFDYLFIPEVLLKKSKTLYIEIDSTDIVKYIDPYSMFYYQTLVGSDCSYIGKIISKYPIRKNEYEPKPTINNYVYELAYKKFIEIKPDIVFTVQNIGEYFFIKDNELFALTRKSGTFDDNFIVYHIDEYIKIFKEDIFAPIFRYVPRIELIRAF